MRFVDGEEIRVTNTYDVDGIRESKMVGGILHNYVTLDGKVVRETCRNSTVDYFYDNDGRPYRFTVKVGANDPAISRFINADSGISGNGEELLGYNMYTDCFNNPINLDDSEGNWPIFRNIVKAVKVIVYVEYPRVESWNDSATSAFIDFKTEERPIIEIGSMILEILGMR